MKFTREQLCDLQAAVRYYQLHNISNKSPRYQEYEVILQLLRDYKETQ